jgi:hypothetical protein
MQGALDEGRRVRFRVSGAASGNHTGSAIDREWTKEKNSREKTQRSLAATRGGAKEDPFVVREIFPDLSHHR